MSIRSVDARQLSAVTQACHETTIYCICGGIICAPEAVKGVAAPAIRVASGGVAGLHAKLITTNKPKISSIWLIHPQLTRNIQSPIYDLLESAIVATVAGKTIRSHEATNWIAAL